MAQTSGKPLVQLWRFSVGQAVDERRVLLWTTLDTLSQHLGVRQHKQPAIKHLVIVAGSWTWLCIYSHFPQICRYHSAFRRSGICAERWRLVRMDKTPSVGARFCHVGGARCSCYDVSAFFGWTVP